MKFNRLFLFSKFNWQMSGLKIISFSSENFTSVTGSWLLRISTVLSNLLSTIIKVSKNNISNLFEQNLLVVDD